MQIREIHITMAKEGMVIATDIYTDKNELVLPVNTVLDKEIIQQLKRYGIFRLTFLTIRATISAIGYRKL